MILIRGCSDQINRHVHSETGGFDDHYPEDLECRGLSSRMAGCVRVLVGLLLADVAVDTGWKRVCGVASDSRSISCEATIVALTVATWLQASPSVPKRDLIRWARITQPQALA